MIKRALITGITGMVGSHLADYLLLSTDWEIHGFLRWSDNLINIQHLSSYINNKDRIFLHYGDLNDAFSVQKAIKKAAPDYVFHLAAQSYPQTSFESPADTLHTNVIGTCNVLESCRLDSAINPIIHVCSSSEVFGRVSKEKTPIKEDCSFHPASPYAISKTGVDLLGQHYAEAYGMNIQITRMFTHTGPRRGDVFAESSFAKQIAMIEAGLQEPVIKVGNLNSMRTWADVRDAVRAYYMAVTINPVPGAVYNIGGSFSFTVFDMLKTLVGMTSMEIYTGFDDKHGGFYAPITNKVSIVTDPDRLRPIDADLQIPDTSKFRNHTGWKPEIPFEKTMRDLLDYWRGRVKKEGAFLNR